MRAALFLGVGRPLEVVDDVEIDQPRPGEVMVQVEHCGVCHSDLGIIDGDMPFPTPVILGHEASGVVVETGSGVTSLKKGDRVVATMRPPCGHCYWCVRDQPVLCERTVGPPGGDNVRLRYKGEPVARGFRLAAFAERLLVEESGAIRIPDAIPLQTAAVMGCAVQTGVGSVVNVAEVEAGATALVIGAGGIGLSVVQGLVLAGASTIVAIDPVESRRATAAELGATATLDSRDPDIKERLDALTRGIGLDYAFDSVSSEGTTGLAMAALRRGGSLILIGVPAADHNTVGFTPRELVLLQKSVKGSFLGNCNAQRDFPRFFDLCSTNRLDLGSLVTNSRPLSEINEAFEDMRKGLGVRTVLKI